MQNLLIRLQASKDEWHFENNEWEENMKDKLEIGFESVAARLHKNKQCDLWRNVRRT